MSFLQNLLGIGGSYESKTTQLPWSADTSFDQEQGRVMDALRENMNMTGQVLSAGMDSYMPSTYDDLGGMTNTAMYSALSPESVNQNTIEEYAQQLGQSAFRTDLTSPQSMADRARAAEMFSGL